MESNVAEDQHFRNRENRGELDVFDMAAHAKEIASVVQDVAFETDDGRLYLAERSLRCLNDHLCQLEEQRAA